MLQTEASEELRKVEAKGRVVSVPVASMGCYFNRSKDPKFNQYCPVLLMWHVEYEDS